MAKKVQKPSKTAPIAPEIAPPSDDAVQSITTIHGEVVPLADVQHIAEHLRMFAIAADRMTRDAKNTRRHGDSDVASTAASLKRFGMEEAIRFDPADMVVKVGNGRHEAAQSILKWKYVAAVPWTKSAEELRVYAVTHNATAEKSSWDFENLGSELDWIRDYEASAIEISDLPPIEEMGVDDDYLAELQEDREAKTKRRQSSAEGKEQGGGGGGPVNFIVQITCGSERHQTQVLQAILDNDAKALLKLLHGVDVRAKAN